jgi:DNA mismatch endonuclease, patch repair protein
MVCIVATNLRVTRRPLVGRSRAPALTRSEQMSRIRSSDTRPEMALRSALWHRGLRYRLGQRIGSARPDLIMVRERVAIFIDGCFWHGCPVHYLRPRTREDYWSLKLWRNVTRDIEQTAGLIGEGWRVVRVWEHAIAEDIEASVGVVLAALNDPEWRQSDGWRVCRVEAVDDSGSLERRHLRALDETAPAVCHLEPRQPRIWSRKLENQGPKSGECPVAREIWQGNG